MRCLCRYPKSYRYPSKVSFDLKTIIKAYDVRGLAPCQLSPDVAYAIGAAFARVVVIEPKLGSAGVPSDTGRMQVVIGQDMRQSGPQLVAAFTQALQDAGVDVIQIGLCSTDGLYYAAASRGCAGAMFTASHNPAEYNGIKMCYPKAKPVGVKTGLADIRQLAQSYLDGNCPAPVSPQRSGVVTKVDDLPNYARFLHSLVDVSRVRRLKVVVDAGNGMAGLTAPAVLGSGADVHAPAWPLELVPLYWELDGSFPNHEANPLEAKNLVDLQRAVVAQGADLGLAFDGDADRCFVVDELGNTVSPSVISALVGLRELARAEAAGESHPTLIYNLILSKVVPEQFTASGARVVRTRSGHSFIKAEMVANDAVFGCEHSGHFYFRDFWFADSGMLTALHVLAALGSQPKPLSALAAQYQPYVQSGELNTQVEDIPQVCAQVAEAMVATHPGAKVDYLDGVTVSYWDDALPVLAAPEHYDAVAVQTTASAAGSADDDAAGDVTPDDDAATRPKWWFNLRGSNTEPLLRLNVEGTDDATMQDIRDQVLNLIRQNSGGHITP